MKGAIARFLRLASLLAVPGACGGGGPASAPIGVVPEGAVARVGGESVHGETVARLGAAQRIGRAEARDRALFDAIFAVAARERLSAFTVRAVERSAYARVLLARLAGEARSAGPPTDAEVEAATARRFWELDRPPMLRTTHAVVVVKAGTDVAAARSLADRIEAVVTGAGDPVAFRKAVEGVPKYGLDLRVEDLDPVARDGRTVDLDHPPPPGSPAGKYTADFVEAAYAIPSVGRVSPVVRTSFGFHVILAVARVPEKRIPLEERRTLLEDEILNGRAVALRGQVLAKARTIDLVEFDRAALDLTQQVEVRR